MNTIGIIGAGLMGNGIAHVVAAAGMRAVLSDITVERADAGKAVIAKNLARGLAKGTIDEAGIAAILARIETTMGADRFADADLVIEAATENEAIKREIFAKLDANTPASAILASNTSSISITKLAAATSRPERVIGMHYMNPVPVMALVEIIRGIATSQATYETVRDLAIRHGKTPVEVRNYPGFASNRILCPMLNEAIFALFEGVGTVEAIDTVMKLGMNHPMGPLELADFIGLDTLASILDVLREGLGDPKYRACPLLREYVAAGWLGRKSGLGFYDWRGGTRAPRADLGPSGVPAFAS